MVATRKTSSLDSSTWNRAGAGVDATYLGVGDDSGREFGKGCKLVRKEMVMILQVLFQSDSTVSRVIFSYPYHWWTVVIKEFKAANCRFVVTVRDSLNQKVRDSGVHIRLFRNWSVVAAMECHTFSKGQLLVKQKEGVRFIRGWKKNPKDHGLQNSSSRETGYDESIFTCHYRGYKRRVNHDCVSFTISVRYPAITR